MANLTRLTTLALATLLISTLPSTAEEQRLVELDAFWTEVATSVQAGDFKGYGATCHPTGVLVNGINGTSYPLSTALVRWKPGFEDTRSGKIKAQVTFRFNQRLGDATTAHETGMFFYRTEDASGNRTEAYIHFEALLVKEERWLIVMEYQKSRGTREDWEKLK